MTFPPFLASLLVQPPPSVQRGVFNLARLPIAILSLEFRLHPSKADILYSVVNVTLPRARKAKIAKKQAYVQKWKISASDDTPFSAVLEMSRKIGDGNLTCFDVRCASEMCSFDRS